LFLRERFLRAKLVASSRIVLEKWNYREEGRGRREEG
jgi:hypothetical protein